MWAFYSHTEQSVDLGRCHDLGQGSWGCQPSAFPASGVTGSLSCNGGPNGAPWHPPQERIVFYILGLDYENSENLIGRKVHSPDPLGFELDGITISDLWWGKWSICENKSANVKLGNSGVHFGRDRWLLAEFHVLTLGMQNYLWELVFKAQISFLASPTYSSKGGSMSESCPLE